MTTPLASAPSCAARFAPEDAAILRLWRECCDTAEIARRLGYGEAQIANRLARLRDGEGVVTPTQAELHRARRERLARMQAAAARHAATLPPERAAALPLASPRREAPRWSPRNSAARGDGPSVPQIQELVCIRLGFALADLISPRRPAPLVRARQVAIYLARELTPLSMAKIGQLFGDRDHSTILASHRKIADRIKVDAGLRNTVTELSENLRGSVAQR